MIGKFLNKKAMGYYQKYSELLTLLNKHEARDYYYNKYQYWNNLYYRWREIVSFLKMFLIVVIILVVFFSSVFGAIAVSCNNFTQNTGLVTKYDPLSGCYAELDGRWVLKEQIRYYEVK